MLTTERIELPAATPTGSTYSLEYKLAVIDEGGSVDESDQKSCSDSLFTIGTRKTTNNRQQIADITVSTQQKGREYTGKILR